MTIICSACSNPIKTLGALLFSPPDRDMNCTKYHICVSCFKTIDADFKLIAYGGERIHSTTNTTNSNRKPK